MTNEEAIKRLKSTKDFLREEHSEKVKSDIYRKFPELKELENDTYKDNQESFDIAISALRAQQWISVEEALPENGMNILVANAKTGTQYVSHKDLIWFSPEREAFVPTSYFQEFEFTHWMQLPEPPKEG